MKKIFIVRKFGSIVIGDQLVIYYVTSTPCLKYVTNIGHLIFKAYVLGSIEGDFGNEISSEDAQGKIQLIQLMILT
ncbi:hypothetical protein BpHYR1_036198 [Brachionus plicatilis]|uniref:Uncharacterized protein n=1 Tax=Brachionus plicatilis TaxID=10195 RepID=A0A3M7RJT0_BRAPC|nr:hypothetical protein BpHYR1_036198 [Brachionus plicatilis]